MKILSKLVVGLLVIVVLGLVVLRVTGLDPKQRRPGLWLTGNVVTSPVTDWAFTDKYPTIMIQTNTPYMIPHSVTINCVSYMGHMYLHSTFPAGMPSPSGKSWTSALARDPRVRIKVADQLYDRTATPVTDQAELAHLNEAAAKKFPQTPAAKGAIVYYFRVND